MIRYLVLALILSTLLVGILDLLDRAQKPLLIDANLVTKADYPLCVTVRPGPIKPPTHPVLNPHVSEVV